MMSLFKNLFVIIGLLVLAGLGYYLFILERGSELSDSASASRTSQSELEVQEFLRRLADVESITLPTDVFTDPRFKSFEDFGTEVDRVPVGRTDPFTAP